MKKKLISSIIIGMIVVMTTSTIAANAMSDLNAIANTDNLGRGDKAIAYMSWDESQQNQNGIYTFSTDNPHIITCLSTWQPGDYGYATGGTYDLNGNLYMVDGSDTSSFLYQIDQSTWIGTAIGGTGYPMHAMTCDPTTGIIYCAGGAIYDSTDLYTIDPATGTATLVGSLGGLSGVFDLAVDGNGQMYAIDVYTDSLYTVDKATGAVTIVGATGQNMNFEQDMCWDANAQILYATAFIWGSNSVFCNVNVATGSVTILDVFGFPQFDALCFPLGTPQEDFPPQTTITLNGLGGPEIFTSEVAVTLTAVDTDETGVNATYYKVDTNPWQIYTIPFVVSSSGPHQIQYYSDDTAIPPNVEELKTATFSIQYPLGITITGGLGATATISNPNSSPITLNGSFTVTGFTFPKTKNIVGTVEGNATFPSKLILFGIGPIAIHVNVNGYDADATGFVLGIFLLGVK